MIVTVGMNGFGMKADNECNKTNITCNDTDNNCDGNDVITEWVVYTHGRMVNGNIIGRNGNDKNR